MNWFKRIRRAKEPVRAGDKGAIEDELLDWQVVTAENKEQQSHATIRLRVRKPPLPDGRAFDCAVEMNGFSELVQVSTGMSRKDGQIWSDVVDAVQGRDA